MITIPARTLPDIAICRAKRSGFGGYVDCLVEHPFGCALALSFGGSYLCRHPEREKIVAQTADSVSEWSDAALGGKLPDLPVPAQPLGLTFHRNAGTMMPNIS